MTISEGGNFVEIVGFWSGSCEFFFAKFDFISVSIVILKVEMDSTPNLWGTQKFTV
jgi:hypothetical protein